MRHTTKNLRNRIRKQSIRKKLRQQAKQKKKQGQARRPAASVRAPVTPQPGVAFPNVQTD